MKDLTPNKSDLDPIETASIDEIRACNSNGSNGRCATPMTMSRCIANGSTPPACTPTT